MDRNSNLTKRRWMVLIASCMINLCIGALYTWSVFAGPMAEYLSGILGRTLTAADLAIVFSVGNSTGFITMIAGGAWNEKIGPKFVILIGGILFGLGFVVCGFATSVLGLLMGYGVCSGFAMGLAYGCTISNSVKFFPDKAGLVGGIATASYGISSVLIPPVANKLIENLGVCNAFITIGGVIVVVVGIFSQFIIKCPVDFVPNGWKQEQEDAAAKEEGIDVSWRQMIRMPVFYIMLVMLFFGAVLGMMVISQASGMAQNMLGMTSASAAVIVSVLALFNTLGRIVAGMISDRIGCIRTIRCVFVLAIAAIALLYWNQGLLTFCVGICLVGVCFGSFMGVYPSFTAERFGRTHASVNYGIMFVGFNAAGLLGPIFMGKIYAQTGAYSMAFILAILFAALGLILSFSYRDVYLSGE